MTFVLVALGAGLAVAVELLEALAIVVAVALSGRWSDALIGAAAAVMACGALAIVLGPVVLGSVPLTTLRVAIGALLMLFGLSWLRKNTLRLAGRRPASSPPDVSAGAGRLVAFKGVLLEGAEVTVIVTALAARPSGPWPALVGAGVAAVAVVLAGAWLRRPLERVPETELKWGVGVLLSAFGVFFLAEGLGLQWPGGDAAVVYIVAAFAGVSRLVSRSLAQAGARPRRRTPV